MQFYAKIPLKYAIFSYFMFTIFDFCNFSSFFANFSHFFWKYPNFVLKFSGSFRISKTTHKTGLGKIRIFQKNIHPCPQGEAHSWLQDCDDRGEVSEPIVPGMSTGGQWSSQTTGQCLQHCHRVDQPCCRSVYSAALGQDWSLLQCSADIREDGRDGSAQDVHRHPTRPCQSG